MKLWIWRWGPALTIMILIFIASTIPGSDLPEFGVWDFSIKKTGHMLGYALLTAAYLHGMDSGRRTARFRSLIAICLAILYAVSDEFHQTFTPGRNASPWDVCIDAVGGGIGLAVWYLIRTRFWTGNRSNPSQNE
jgi:VanZ family protein